MRLVGEAVQEADGDGFDLLAAKVGGDGTHGRLVDRQQHRAVGGDPFGDAEAQVARHQRLGPLHVDVVLLEAMLPGHLERIAEACRRDQGRPRALAFDQGVGGQGRAVHDQRDVAWPAFRLGQDGSHAVQHGAFGRVGRGQDLGGVGCRVGSLADFQHDIGESAADIDGQTRRHYSSSLMLPLRTTSPHMTESRWRKAR